MHILTLISSILAAFGIIVHIIIEVIKLKPKTLLEFTKDLTEVLSDSDKDKGDSSNE